MGLNRVHISFKVQHSLERGRTVRRQKHWQPGLRTRSAANTVSRLGGNESELELKSYFFCHIKCDPSFPAAY